MIFLHFILVLPSPFALGVPNAKVGLTKTEKSEGIFWLAQVLYMLLPLMAMSPLNLLEIKPFLGILLKNKIRNIADQSLSEFVFKEVLKCVQS